MNKVFKNAMEAIHDIQDGTTLMVGGFGLCGIPENLIKALREKGVKNLTVMSNNAGVNDFGLGILLQTKQIRKMISTYVGENEIFEQQCLKGEIEVELIPQGTFSERIRAGGAGIAAFFTPTGVGTLVEQGKEKRIFNGREYILERSLKADFALIKAYKGDAMGNLVYRKTARNFNPMMATAAAITIAEVEEVVPVGAIDPDHVHTPGIFVKRIFRGVDHEKRIEKRTYRPSNR
jgi:3-oxoacid CoA-transferase subunit A